MAVPTVHLLIYRPMQFVFYLVTLVAFVYVIFGIVQTTLFSVREIPRGDLPPVIDQECRALFPDFAAHAIKKHAARHRYHLDGNYGDKPGQLVFALTPESELSILEFSQLGQTRSFQRIRSLSNIQVPPKIASTMQPFLVNDQIQYESGKVELGLLGEDLSYRIQVDSRNYRYQFDVLETGELFAFSRRDVA